ncbi:YqcC family protein [Larsenimonas salina]|uniref:YqcC family protein n=1 Tax=Larsenimonas salina TaxID=1295565 RepID=UPI0020732832|nr:YqcC family protein [Larsenimonas salina]MCM5704785.1 YqcC family protein [Larsenimonas salina]
MTQQDSMKQAVETLEAAMKAADLWRLEQPAAQAFASQTPFCVDTMSLPQWLRFVLIPKLNALLDANAALPASSSIAPAAELYLKEYRYSTRISLIQALERIDGVMNGTH